MMFQSTHSLRSATEGAQGELAHALFQSTHSLRSATERLAVQVWVGCVSIHALLAECDPLRQPLRGSGQVSIHALLAECDVISVLSDSRINSFNPRTPCGVRRPFGMRIKFCWKFQSTHSLRSATIDKLKAAVKYLVSIHALLAECDSPAPCLNLLPFVSIHALLAECDYY